MAGHGIRAGIQPGGVGTVGSIPGVILVALAYPQLGLTSQIVLSILTTLFAIPCCELAERHFGKKDDGGSSPTST